jgi:SpoVK/Ycf46/Vps4 family AAA+-type ATPase
LYQTKRIQIEEMVARVETLKGEERKTIREALYERLLLFATSAALFINTYINNFVLLGGPGVGKTTVADVIAYSLYRIGLLLTPNVYERSEADLLASYSGQTAPRTRAALESALEAVVFIDEAYSVSGCPDERTGLYTSAYGKEAINTLVGWSSENAGLISIIVAGYPEEMIRCFFGANPGLRRRFGSKYRLPNYNAAALFSILDTMITQRNRSSTSGGTARGPGGRRNAPVVTDLVSMFGAEDTAYLAKRMADTYRERPSVFEFQGGDMANLSDSLLQRFGLQVAKGEAAPLEHAAARSVIDDALDQFIADKSLLTPASPS